METVAADTLRRLCLGQRVAAGDIGGGGMESGIKARELRQVRRAGAQGVNGGKVCGVVQRGQAGYRRLYLR